MLENSALFSRLLFFIALVCAAVMSFIMRSDAARASPITTQVDNGVWHNVQRRLYTPYSQHHSLSAGLFPTETGLQTVTTSETETSRDYGEPLSIIDHQSNLPRFTEGSLGYNQNIPDNRKSHVGITGARSEVTSANSIFTSHSQHVGQSFERQQPMENYPPLSQEVPQSGNSFYSHPVIIRKSFYKETAGPFHQSPLSSHIWDPKNAQKSYNKEKFPSSYSPTVDKDETVWQSSDFPLFSSQSGRYLSTSLPTSRGHYSDYKETNELAVVRPRSTTGGIQSSKFFSITSQNAPRASSISNGLEASVIKSNPSPGKLTPSITGFTQGPHSVSNNETPGHKKFQSYLFKDSQASSGGNKIVTIAGDGPDAFFTTSHEQKLSDPHVYGGLSSNFKQLLQSQTKEPPKEIKGLSDDASLQYYNPNVAQYDAQTDSFTKYQHPTAETAAQMSAHPASGADNTKESVVRIPNADFQSNYVTSSEESVVSSLVNTTTSGSTHANKPGRTVKSIYGFQGFRNPVWRAKKRPSGFSSRSLNERTNSNWYSFDKGKFKITNIYPSLSPKYSFGQRKAPTTPAKLERPPTDYPSPPPGTSDIIKTITTPRPFTSGLKETRPLLPESDAGMDNNPDRRRFKIYRKVYGLKGFSSWPLEGTKPSVSEPDKPVRGHERSEGLKLRSSQIWQINSSRIHGLYNKTEPGSSHVATTSQNLTAGGAEAGTTFTPDKYKKGRKIYTHMGFHPVQKRIGYAHNKTLLTHREKDPTPASVSHRISSAYLRSAGDLRVESSPQSEPRTPSKTKPAAVLVSPLNSSTRSTVIGKRVTGKHINGKKFNASTSLTNVPGIIPIVRLPKRPARVKAVTYADILGSASFSGVRATTQTPITPTDKDYFPNITANKQEAGVGPSPWTLKSEDAVYHKNNTSKGPEVHAKDEKEDFRRVKGNKLGVKGDGVDSEMKTSGLFLDNEGSGSGGFNMSDVFSTDATKTQGLNEDSLELDYLRISTGNISFKSMKRSHTEK